MWRSELKPEYDYCRVIIIFLNRSRQLEKRVFHLSGLMDAGPKANDLLGYDNL